ncbi:beta-lactamase/transpeptidase-like protein [Trichoderma austrokoningii]
MDKLDAILKGAVADGEDTRDKLLGAAFIVTDRNGIIYSGSAGRTGIDVDSPRFDGDTLTYGASITKLLSATCIMQLVEQGKISLDHNMRLLVPELDKMQILRGFTAEGQPVLEDNDSPITLKQLMVHTVGLRYDVADPNLRRWSEAIGRPIGRAIRMSRDGYNTPLVFRPGSGWAYGSALDWAGVGLETLAKQSLGSYMKTHVLDPLQMRDTAFRVGQLPHTAGRRAQIAVRDAVSGALSALDLIPEEPEMDSAGAGIHTTANDYVRLLRALLQAEPGVVSAETAAMMFAPQLDERQRAMMENVVYGEGGKEAYIPEMPDGVALQYGYGGMVMMGDAAGLRRRRSLSWSGACSSRWWIDPEAGIAAVLMVGMFPFGDAVSSRLYTHLQRAVYEMNELHGIQLEYK